MKLDYDNLRTRTAAQIDADDQVEHKSPLALFESFYQQQNNQPMSDRQRAFVSTLMEHIWEEEPS